MKNKKKKLLLSFYALADLHCAFPDGDEPSAIGIVNPM